MRYFYQNKAEDQGKCKANSSEGCFGSNDACSLAIFSNSITKQTSSDTPGSYQRLLLIAADSVFRRPPKKSKIGAEEEESFQTWSANALAYISSGAT